MSYLHLLFNPELIRVPLLLKPTIWMKAAFIFEIDRLWPCQSLDRFSLSKDTPDLIVEKEVDWIIASSTVIGWLRFGILHLELEYELQSGLKDFETISPIVGPSQVTYVSLQSRAGPVLVGRGHNQI
ncbi:hypothetical protein Tco_1252960 [Tanacetum coccineum]